MKFLYVLALALSVAIPAVANHVQSDYTIPFVVRTSRGFIDGTPYIPHTNIQYQCTMDVTIKGHYLSLGSGQLGCRDWLPGYHGVGKFGSTWGVRWFEIMWNEGGNVHYHKYNIISDYYSGN